MPYSVWSDGMAVPRRYSEVVALEEFTYAPMPTAQFLRYVVVCIGVTIVSAYMVGPGSLLSVRLLRSYVASL